MSEKYAISGTILVIQNVPLLAPKHTWCFTLIHNYVLMILISLRSVLNQKGWRNSEIEARIQRIEAGEDLGEEEGLYATYAMLHTYRKE